MPSEKTKRCRQCNAEKPLSAFGKNSSRKDGIHYYCRACLCERSRNWRKANPEKAREGKRRWAKTDKGRAMKARERAKNKAKYAERERKRRAEKPDEIRAQWQAWAKRNAEHVRRYSREYQRNHPRPRAGEKHIDPESVGMVSVLRNDPCAYCGGAGGEIDHIEPASAGGGNEWTNFTSACPTCNRKKNAKPLLTFLLDNPLT